MKHRVFTEISEATVLNPATNSTMENVSGRKISIDGAIGNSDFQIGNNIYSWSTYNIKEFFLKY